MFHSTTCRNRHMKCNEVKPICGQCAKGNRTCVYGVLSTDSTPPRISTATFTSGDDQRPPNPPQHSQHGSFSSTTDVRQQGLQQGPTTPTANDTLQITSPQNTYSSTYGTEVAPLRWFGLLVGDAADISLDLPSPESLSESALSQRHRLHPDGVSIHGLRTPSQTSAALAEGVSLQSPSKLLQLSGLSPLPAGQGNSSAEELNLWQAQEPIQLEGHEFDMFRRFVSEISLWIDLFDPLKHFSTFVPHLALHNEGLMKAVLALGARHLSIKPLNDGEVDVDRTAAVQYYYETLQYLQSAMRYTSYKNSLELLATVLVVSTYEMIDGAGKGWERHLKGVFWIQRSRDINGESGGLEQAIWWAWLRQDVWAAFREHRRCFSFFKPTKPYHMMDIWDMASRIVYILAQSVNYSSEEEAQLGEPNLSGRILQANTLLNMLDEWRTNISIHFRPLPVEIPPGQIFEPLWIHPPAFGTSMQMYSVARILLLIHQPAAGGYLEYLSRDKIITESIDTIAGIALKLTDDASRLISMQCLFAAGLYCTDDTKRECIADLIRDHSNHIGWPPNTDLTEELRAEWHKQKPA